MKTLIKYLGYYVAFLLLLVFLCSFLNLLGINNTITNFIIFIFNLIFYFIFGLKNGINAPNKGYIAGLKVGLLFLIPLIIINLFTIRIFFNITTIIYYIILLLTSILGGMMGINKKKN